MIIVSSLSNKKHRSDVGWTNFDLIAELIREVKTRSGSGLTEFWPDVYEEWDEEESLKVIQELWDCPLLEHLNVTSLMINQAFWDFALRLQHLRSLAIKIHSVVEILQVPQGVRKADNLKELELELRHFEVDWLSISEWAGDRLEKLVLRLESESMDGLFCSAFDKSMIINSKQHLKELYLSNEGGESIGLFGEFAQENLNETRFLFPNLEKLYLEDVDSPIFHCFSNAEYPRLQSLGMVGTDDFFAKPSFDCLVKILERADTNIIELEIAIVGINSFECPQSIFNFGVLRKLEIRQFEDTSQKRKMKLPNWLLTSFYPSLTDMKLPGLGHQSQNEISSKLKAQGNAPNLKLN